MIYLYHGTDAEFDTPSPDRGRKGTSSEDDVLKTLRSARFKSVQYSFHSAAAISLLKRIEVKNV